MDWFLLNSGRVEGPFQAQFVKERIEKGEWDDSVLVCRQGDPNWKPLAEWKAEILKEGQPDESIKEWILLTENHELAMSKEQEGQFVQSGPYTKSELLELLKTGSAKYSDFIWKTGFEKWVRINEVDEFFATTPVVESLPVVAEESVAEEVDQSNLLSGVLEQTHLSGYDFVDQERPPEEVNPIDQTLFKPVELPQAEAEVIASSDTEIEKVEFPVETAAEAKGASPFSLPLNLGMAAENKTSAPVKELDQTLYDLGSKYFPWLMVGLAGILAVMVGVWAFSIKTEPARESAHVPVVTPEKKVVPEPTAEIQKPHSEPKTAVAPPAAPVEKIEKVERPQVIAKVPPTVVAKKVAAKAPPTNKTAKAFNARKSRIQPEEVKPQVDLTQLNIIAWRLLKKSERLDQEYQAKKDRPLEWNRFYQSWLADYRKTAELMKDQKSTASPLLRQLQVGQARLGERAAMMNRSVTNETPVSSDFEQEDLPGLFRTLQGQLRRRQ